MTLKNTFILQLSKNGPVSYSLTVYFKFEKNPDESDREDVTKRMEK